MSFRTNPDIESALARYVGLIPELDTGLHIVIDRFFECSFECGDAVRGVSDDVSNEEKLAEKNPVFDGDFGGTEIALVFEVLHLNFPSVLQSFDDLFEHVLFESVLWMRLVKEHLRTSALMHKLPARTRSCQLCKSALLHQCTGLIPGEILGMLFDASNEFGLARHRSMATSSRFATKFSCNLWALVFYGMLSSMADAG